ncbi:MAG TPA: immunoglobulin-like domain-containing protein [Chthoniobacteraceae bacterium]|nr:immunoglobulin-like domain-containing protein [Chthoniobacteraceae bacterium]
MRASLQPILALCALFVPLTAKGQGVTQAWVQRYNGPANGGDGGNAVVIGKGGEIVVTGASVGVGTGQDIYTAKYASANGALLWEKRVNFGGEDFPSKAAIDGNGDVIVAGRANFVDIALVKYAREDGTVLWQRSYDGAAHMLDNVYDMAVDAQGNIFVTGYTQTAAGTEDIYSAKYAGTDGTLIWQRTYNGPANNNDDGNALALDANGDVIVAGSSFGAAFDIYTAKYAGISGALIWEKIISTNNGDAARDVAVDANGDVFITGGGGGAATDVYTVKFRGGDGQELWRRTYSSAGSFLDSGNALALDTSGDVVITARVGGTGTGGGDDWYTAKYAGSTGSVIWGRQFSGPAGSVDTPAAIAVDARGNAVVAGLARISGTGPANNDFYVIKYAASNGVEMWSRSYNGPGNSTDSIQFIHALSVTPDGVVVTGNSTGSGTGLDLTTIKYADAPLVTTQAADQITQAAARINASVLPNSFATTGSFEYGLSPILDGAVSTAPTNIGSGTSTVTVRVTISGLQPGATYYFRAVGTGNGVTQRGQILSFTTLPDTMPPVLAPVSIASNNTNPRYAKTGDIITLDFTASEVIQTPTVTIAGRMAAVAQVAGNSWRATLPTTVSVVEGIASLSVAAQDIAGNAAAPVIATTNGTSVTVDRTPPTLLLNGPNPLTVEGATPYVEPGAIASDTIAGDLTAAVQITGTVNTAAVGSNTRTYTVSDFAGNITQVERIVLIVDTTPPVITLLGANPLTVELPATYVEPGATAADTVAGDLTAAIQVSSNVNLGAIGTYTVTYSVSDGYNTSQVMRTVRVVDRPVANTDTLGTKQDTQVSAPGVKLLANDYDPSGHPLSLVGVAAASAQGGSVMLADGLITYTPPMGFAGTDSFIYMISDGFGGTATGIVQVTVSPADAYSLNFVSLTRTAEGFLIRFAGIPGECYLVQFTDGLLPPQWITLDPPGPIRAGVNGLFEVEDKPSPLPPQRFYRATTAH